MKAVYGSTFAALFALGFALPAEAAGISACGNSKLYIGTTDIQLLDRGEPGIGPSDERFGLWQLVDEDGKEVSLVHFNSTIVASNGDGTHHLVGSGTEAFENGTINWTGSYEMTDPSYDGPPRETLVVSIVGGTGDFAGAGGTLTWFYDDDGRRAAAYEIVCLQ